jgi:predicted RNA binding protein YcfA (HicA-like mRNA interferase family)
VRGEPLTQLAKLKDRFRQKAKDLTWSELEKLLSACGYQSSGQGSTAGSRRRFVHPNGSFISLHEPHPQNILKRYQVEQVLEILITEGFL